MKVIDPAEAETYTIPAGQEMQCVWNGDKQRWEFLGYNAEPVERFKCDGRIEPMAGSELVTVHWPDDDA